MCIIAIYQNGKKPDKTTLDYMIKGNPDGIGVAWNDGREVYFIKGLKTAESVLNVYERANRDGEVLDFVFHARIATSGGVSAEKCHPFVVSSNNNILDKTSGHGRTPVAFHNGIFPITPDNGLNDTQTLIKHCIAPLYERDAKGLQKGKHNAVITLATRGSRFVLLYPDRLYTFGEWESEDGVLYSNSHYKEPKYKYYYNDYYDDIDGGWYGKGNTKTAGGSSYLPAKYRVADAIKKQNATITGASEK